MLAHYYTWNLSQLDVSQTDAKPAKRGTMSVTNKSILRYGRQPKVGTHHLWHPMVKVKNDEGGGNAAHLSIGASRKLAAQRYTAPVEDLPMALPLAFVRDVYAFRVT